MPVPNLCAVFHLTFFLGRAYGGGVPLLRYSAPVVKATIDDVKVASSQSIGILSESRVTDLDL